MPSQTVENYIKSIYHLTEHENINVSTSALSDYLNTTPASVTDMLKKLSDQKLIDYKKYQGVRLSGEGKSLALGLIRKHRLWETFLYEKLHISWDAVHEIAEQLEHVKSDLLIEQLDIHLGRPKYDPHGDPIPDAFGKFTFRHQIPLSQAPIGKPLKIVGVKDHQTSFLKYLETIPIAIEQQITITERIDYDQSLQIEIDQSNRWNLSALAAANILVKPI
jgi:DtxR family transcriptional regulator, Mn-dependent transcriptional regulator